jgi:catechol 2,3-dioxygenase-like lactoylglutathione lyase family enzyme
MLENAQLYTSLPVKDLERAKQFYQEKLGLTPKEETEGNVFYETGGSKFFLYYSPSAGSNQTTAACFNVADVEGTVAQLKNRGVEFEHYDEIPGVRRDGDIHYNEQGFQCSWFKDSEDNIISVSQYA